MMVRKSNCENSKQIIYNLFQTVDKAPSQEGAFLVS